MSPEFLLAALVVVASPGTGAVYTIAAALTRGARAAVLAAIACTLGTLPPMVFSLPRCATVCCRARASWHGCSGALRRPFWPWGPSWP